MTVKVGDQFVKITCTLAHISMTNLQKMAILHQVLRQNLLLICKLISIMYML